MDSVKRRYRKTRSGLTLIEVIVSIAILAIIVVPFLLLFTQSAFSVRDSRDMVDTTYIAQQEMESAYVTIQDDANPDAPVVTEYTVEGYLVEKTITVEDGIFARVLIRVYDDAAKERVRSQLETLYPLES